MKIDERKLHVSMLLDLKQAFDRVDHNILLSKLLALDIRGKTHCWSKAYLKNRKQFCHVECQKSPARKIDYGIPQELCKVIATKLGSISHSTETVIFAKLQEFMEFLRALGNANEI